MSRMARRRDLQREWQIFAGKVGDGRCNLVGWPTHQITGDVFFRNIGDVISWGGHPHQITGDVFGNSRRWQMQSRVVATPPDHGRCLR